MAKVVLVVGLLFLPICGIHATEAVQQGALQLSVTDHGGYKLPGARALLHRHPSGLESGPRELVTSAHTDSEGAVQIAIPEPGIYTVRVDLEGFFPVRVGPVIIEEGTLEGHRTVTVVVVLNPDPTGRS